jgi:glycosyltransferase involved in cell wall biosynthesis
MKNVNVNCPINGTGYGITSKNIIIELSKLNIDISLFPIGQQIQIDSEEEKNAIEKMLHNSAKYNPKSPCLKIWHQHDLASKIGNGKYYVFPFFESDKLFDREIHQLNCSDHVFTASKWGKEVLENNGVTSPITVVPLGINPNIFRVPDKIKTQNPNYIFFHVGKWEMRKSQDVLIEAFNKSFEETDNVELWLLPHNPFLSKEEEQQWFSLVNNSKLKEKIKIYNRLPTHYHLAEFLFNADCGVFLSRAEGWNNEIPESMAMNKPIIATNYSAHTEYCNKDNSFLVEINELEPASDGKWFHGHGNWAKIGEQQIEQTVEYMRYVYRNNIRHNPNGLETAGKLHWSNTASIINQSLNPKKNYNATTTKKPRRKQTKVSK